jgi:SAM-dependent methyltransferase
MNVEPEHPNREQIEFWNAAAGERWVRGQARIDELLEPITRALLERARVERGHRLIDIGCGCGTTSLELGRRTGSAGRVLGIDVSAQMLAHARTRLGPGDRHVVFEQADASSYAFEPAAADQVFSRFGVMFFSDPVAAFRNFRAALRPRGRLVFSCWQALADNDWARLPLLAALAHLPPPEPPEPGAPGPFAFAEAARVREILQGAGYGDIHLEELRTPLRLRGSIEDVAALYQEIGPLSRFLEDAEPQARVRAVAALRDTVAAHHDGTQMALGSATWLVTATA